MGFVASAARTTSGTSASFGVSPAAQALNVAVNVTAVSGTPSMTLSVQWSNDGVTWFDGDPADSFTAITAAPKALVKQFATKASIVRLSWAITGGTPSVTFSADYSWVHRPSRAT
jgi:hypothetical protein